MIIILTIAIIFCIPILFMVSTKSGRKVIGNICYRGGQINFIPVMVGVAIIHFLISLFLFGFSFAMGESGKNSPVVLAFLYKVICFNPIMLILQFFDNKTSRMPIPSFLYFPISFIANSLLWGFIITWLIKLGAKPKKSWKRGEKGTE